MRRNAACANTLFTLLVLVLSFSSVSAQNVVINATNRGWFGDGGDHNSFSSSENYFAGDAAEVNGREYRNFFIFDLSSVSQPIGSARLLLSAGRSYDSADPTENYELHDVTTPISTILHPPGGLSVPAFIDFGSGVVYGSRTMTATDVGNVVEIELNSSAIAAMNATHGPFGIGGSITTLDSVRNFEGVFGFTGSSQSISQLRLTLVPEPSSGLLCLAAIFATQLRRHRRRF